MEYTDKQIEEAVAATIDTFEKENPNYIADESVLAKLIMRMMREEAELRCQWYNALARNDDWTCKDIVRNQKPREFWKEPKKPATESQWQPIGTLPADNTLVLLGHNMCPPFTGWRDKATGIVQSSERTGFVVSYWMPIPELPK